MKKFIGIFLGMSLIAASAFAADAAKEPIKVGEMMPYTNGTQYAVPFREGYTIALEEINKSGGINGRPLEVISRDDQADPAVAVRVAEDLVNREKVVMLIGAGFDHVGLAVGSYANKNKIPFIKQWAADCEVIEAKSNLYWFVSTPCNTPYAAVFAREAAKQPYKRWATIAPNYAWGRIMTTEFKKELKRLRPDIEFVAEQYPDLGKIKAAEEIRVLGKAKPEAIFSTLFGPDLSAYLLHSRKIGFLDNIFTICGEDIGSPTVIRQLGNVYPKGWFTQGMPDKIQNHPATKFIDKFQKVYKRYPDMMAMKGYQIMLLIAETLRQAKSTNEADILQALNKVSIDGPFGHVSMKNKQIYSGWWLGYTDNQNGIGKFVNSKWYPPEELFPEAFEGVSKK